MSRLPVWFPTHQAHWLQMWSRGHVCRLCCWGRSGSYVLDMGQVVLLYSVSAAPAVDKVYPWPTFGARDVSLPRACCCCGPLDRLYLGGTHGVGITARSLFGSLFPGPFTEESRVFLYIGLFQSTPAGASRLHASLVPSWGSMRNKKKTQDCRSSFSLYSSQF